MAKKSKRSKINKALLKEINEKLDIFLENTNQEDLLKLEEELEELKKLEIPKDDSN